MTEDNSNSSMQGELGLGDRKQQKNYLEYYSNSAERANSTVSFATLSCKIDQCVLFAFMANLYYTT